MKLCSPGEERRKIFESGASHTSAQMIEEARKGHFLGFFGVLPKTWRKWLNAHENGTYICDDGCPTYKTLNECSEERAMVSVLGSVLGTSSWLNIAPHLHGTCFLAMDCGSEGKTNECQITWKISKGTYPCDSRANGRSGQMGTIIRMCKMKRNGM